MGVLIGVLGPNFMKYWRNKNTVGPKERALMVKYNLLIVPIFTVAVLGLSAGLEHVYNRPLLLLVALLILGPFLLMTTVMYNREDKIRAEDSSGWKPPETTGPPVQLRAITPDDSPISESASWHGNELEVKSNDAATQNLFDVELAQVEQCMIAYRFLIQSDDLRSSVYPELWCHIPEKGKFFSKGVDSKISGTNDWTQVEIPFCLERGQVADLLNLNLVFEGEGTVRLKDIEVTSTPVG